MYPIYTDFVPSMYSIRNLNSWQPAPHRSAYSMKCLKNNHINVLKWPVTSSDLNPIENLWDYNDKRLQKNETQEY